MMLLFSFFFFLSSESLSVCGQAAAGDAVTVASQFGFHLWSLWGVYLFIF